MGEKAVPCVPLREEDVRMHCMLSCKCVSYQGTREKDEADIDRVQARCLFGCGVKGNTLSSLCFEELFDSTNDVWLSNVSLRS